jgi:tetratricopeptide (TPR) repeat protein
MSDPRRLAVICFVLLAGQNAWAGEDERPEYWQAQIRRSPSYNNYVWLGVAYGRGGQHEQALAAYRRAIEINAAAPDAYNNICSEYNSLGAWDDAISNCLKAIELRTDFQLAKNNLEAAERAKYQNDPSVRELRNRIASGKDLDTNRISLGLYFNEHGAYEEASRVWGEIPKSSPSYALARSNIACAFIKAKRFDEARKALDEALHIEPGNSRYQANLIWMNDEERAYLFP